MMAVDVDELINQAQSEIYAVSERGNAEDYRQIGDFLDETVKELQELEKTGNGFRYSHRFLPAR